MHRGFPRMGFLTLPIWKTSTYPTLLSAARLPCSTVLTCQHLDLDRAMLDCRLVKLDQWCHRRRCEVRPRDTVTRQLAHEPPGWRPRTLVATIHHYHCGDAWRQSTTQASEPRAKLSRRGLRWVHEGDRGATPHHRPSNRKAQRGVENCKRRCTGRKATRFARSRHPVRPFSCIWY